jgi:hypothetical protein
LGQVTGSYEMAALRPLEEFVRDPALTVACVLLIVVSVAWIVVSRLIYSNLSRAAWKAEAARRGRTRRRRKPSTETGRVADGARTRAAPPSRRSTKI